MFRVKRSIPLSVYRQGYIYYASLLYREMPERKQQQIQRTALAAGSEYADAVLEFVTTEVGAAQICMKYHLSESTLWRAVKRYYLMFPKTL